MSQASAQDRFKALHPQAGEIGQDRLYRYQGLPPDPSEDPIIAREREKGIERLRTLLVDQWLFHGPPKVMNDPFEAKPRYQPPTSLEEAVQLRNHLKKITKDRGVRFKERQKRTAHWMARPELREAEFQRIIHKSFADNRLSSLTIAADDILFWSHYGQSHSGVCFEFASDREPFKHAFKVHYSDDYPAVPFPANHPLEMLMPILTKSSYWKHEQEFRSIIQPGNTRDQFRTVNPEQTHVLIPEDVLTGVYFGANASDEAKRLVLGLIGEGPFNPTIYFGSLSQTQFRIEFEKQ